MTCARAGADERSGERSDTGTGAPLLSVRGLVRRFPGGEAAAVEGVSFDVAPGELIALLGPSGCGKTTTLRMIGGFERPDAGRIVLSGRDVTDLPPEKRGVGFVFQDYALFPHLTVLENVAFGLRAMSRAAARSRASEMLLLVGLCGFAERRPHELSGGQQQRVALARTLAVAPPLVLLDEPFSNLDAALRVETRQEVRGLLKRSGSAGILVTHDQEEALALADRVAVMQGGRLIQIASPLAIHCAPETEFVARFIGRSTILDAVARGETADTPLGPVRLSRPTQGPVTLALRPEQIALTPCAGARGARVVGREFRGHDQVYWVEVEGRRLMVIAGPLLELAVGQRVAVTVDQTVAPLTAR